MEAVVWCTVSCLLQDNVMLDIWRCELSNLYHLANMRCFAVLPMVMPSSRLRQQAADIYLDLHRVTDLVC